MRLRVRSRLAALLLAALAAWPAVATDTLRIGITVPPPSRGNPFTGNGPPGTYVWLAIFDSLTRLDEHGRLTGGLALDWQAVSPIEWRFRLRPGVRFSNGKPVDAGAIAATFAWLKSPPGMRTVIGNELRNVVAARAIDAGTLAIVTRKPDASLPSRLTAVMIVEPEAWARLGPDGFAKAPVGSGPYAVESWGEKDKRTVLIANRHAWRPPRIPRLEFWAMPDNSVRLQALIAREIDLADAATDDLPYLEARGLKTLHAPAMQVMSWAFVTERPGASPLKDVRVRRALNYAVDKQAISRVLLRGLGLPASQPATPVTPGYDPAIEPYPYDPARARALLAEAGYPGGFPLDVQVVVTSSAGDGAIYQVVAQDLGDVGVRVRLRAWTFADFLKNYLAGNWTSDAFGLSWNAAPYNDVTRPMEYFSCRKRKPFFCDPALAADLERANTEFNPARRTELLKQLSRAYHDAAPALFIVNAVDVYAMQPELQGAAIANRIPAYERLWFSATPRRAAPR